MSSHDDPLDVYILDKTLTLVEVVDDYISLLWVEKYDEEGEVVWELDIDFDQTNLVEGYFLSIKDSQRLMIIQDKKYEINEEFGSKLIVSGNSGENILKTRIIEDPVFLTGGLEGNLITLLNNNITSPTHIPRTISIFSSEVSGDAVIAAITYENLFEEGYIYDIIVDIIKSLGLGFIVRFDIPTSKLIFKLTRGIDRSYAQSLVPYVVFSEDYDNLISGEYYTSTTDEKTVVMVLTPDEITALKKVFVFETPEPSGLDRKEMVLENKVDRVVPGYGTLNDEEVGNIISERGLTALRETKKLGAFDAAAYIEAPFKYGLDFFLGDIVQFDLTEDFTKSARVSELVMSVNEYGYTRYVGFLFDI